MSDVSRQTSAAVAATAAAIVVAALLAPSGNTFTMPLLPLGRVVENALPLWTDTLLAAGLVLLNALMLTRISVRYMLYGARTFLPAAIYIAMICGCGIMAGFATGLGSANSFATSPANGVHIAPCLVSTLTVMGIDTLISGLGRGESLDRCARGSLIIGLAVLLYAPAALTVVALPVMLAVLGRSWRETVVATVCALLPAAVLSYIYAWTGEGFLFYPLALVRAVTTPQTVPQTTQLVAAAIPTLLAAAGLAVFVTTGRGMRRMAKRITLIFTTLLLVCWTGLALPCRSADMASLLAVPVAIIAPLYFVRHPGWLSTALYILMLAATAVSILIR